MARTKARLDGEVRIADYLSVGLLTQVCPRDKVEAVLARLGKHSQRERDMPAHAVVYYVLMLGLYMGLAYEEVPRLTLEALNFLGLPGKREVSQVSPVTGTHTPGLAGHGSIGRGMPGADCPAPHPRRMVQGPACGQCRCQHAGRAR